MLRMPLLSYAAGVVNRLNEASKLVRSHLQAAAQTASKWYNNKAKVKTFKPGDIVRVYYPRRPLRGQVSKIAVILLYAVYGGTGG